MKLVVFFCHVHGDRLHRLDNRVPARAARPDCKEDAWLLAHVWLQRFAYRQLFSVVLFKTLKRAMEGRAFNWDKLERTAAMSHAKVGS